MDVDILYIGKVISQLTCLQPHSTLRLKHQPFMKWRPLLWPIRWFVTHVHTHTHTHALRQMPGSASGPVRFGAFDSSRGRSACAVQVSRLVGRRGTYPSVLSPMYLRALHRTGPIRRYGGWTARRATDGSLPARGPKGQHQRTMHELWGPTVASTFCFPTGGRDLGVATLPCTEVSTRTVVGRSLPKWCVCCSNRHLCCAAHLCAQVSDLPRDPVFGPDHPT
jgi:hypothetical protein